VKKPKKSLKYHGETVSQISPVFSAENASLRRRRLCILCSRKRSLAEWQKKTTRHLIGIPVAKYRQPRRIEARLLKWLEGTEKSAPV